MGLLDFLRSLFFGSKKSKPQAIERHDAFLLLDRRFSWNSKKIEKEVFSKIAELKHLLKSLEEYSQNLKKKDISLTEGNFRLRRAVIGSKGFVSGHFLALAQKLEPPKTFDLLELKNYVPRAKAIISTEVLSSSKNIAYTRALMPQEIKELGGSVHEIEQVLLSLETLFQNSGLSKISHAKERLAAFESMHASSMELLAKEKTILSESASISQKKMRLSLDLTELKSSSFAKGLDGLLLEKKKLFDEKNGLRQKFLFLLAGVDKPLSRLVKLSSQDTSLLSHEEKELVAHYFRNVFTASKKDPKAENLKKILSRALLLVENGAIELKEKEKDKRVLALKQLLDYDFFSEVFWKLNSIESDLNVVEKKIAESSVTSKVFSIEREINGLAIQVFSLQSEHQKLSARIRQREKELTQEKLAIEAVLFEIEGKKIELSF